LRYDCAQAQRITERRIPNVADAALYFDVYRRLALPARLSVAYRGSVLDTVERAARLLRRYARDEFAARLERLMAEPEGGIR
jgi:hypothetical protein